MGVCVRERGDRSEGMILSDREHWKVSVEMGAWNESMGMTMWGRELFSVVLFSDY
jgi:hypothetical protein